MINASQIWQWFRASYGRVIGGHCCKQIPPGERKTSPFHLLLLLPSLHAFSCCDGVPLSTFPFFMFSSPSKPRNQRQPPNAYPECVRLSRSATKGSLLHHFTFLHFQWKMLACIAHPKLWRGYFLFCTIQLNLYLPWIWSPLSFSLAFVVKSFRQLFFRFDIVFDQTQVQNMYVFFACDCKKLGDLCIRFTPPPCPPNPQNLMKLLRLVSNPLGKEVLVLILYK